MEKLYLVKQLIAKLDAGVIDAHAHVYVNHICEHLEAVFGRRAGRGSRVIGASWRFPENYDPKEDFDDAEAEVARIFEILCILDENDDIQAELDRQREFAEKRLRENAARFVDLKQGELR